MYRLVLFLLCFIANFSWSQRSYTIKYAKEEIKVDGEITPEEWGDAAPADEFVMNFPNVGAKPTRKTECFIQYTDEAIYFAGKIYEYKDSISYFLSQRDNFGNADYVGITLDTYGNKLNAFAFYVTPAGVELDAIVNEENFDFSWNAVWKSRVVATEYGWSFEMQIPYSAIRFPNKNVQTWNFNIERQIRRTREKSFWNPVDPAKYGEVAQSGKMLGIENIKPPLRLSFSPYVINYVESSYSQSQQKQVLQNRLTGGMDLKWGLNDAFTLDMTLVPDFGQTVSDNQVLNLGPFEVQFDENRSFFKEGTDLFGIGNVFYSRRIGSQPFYASRPYNELDASKGERVVQESSKAPLLNGTKISGRTTSGLGVGVFNALEGKTFALIEDSAGNMRSVETNPLTNYNVTVFSQNLANNGRVSFLNTNVVREGEAREANVSVFSSQFFSKNRDYSFMTVYKLSDKITNGDHEKGHNFFNYIGKVQGEHQYGIAYYEESDTYDPNDLGFLYNNNSRGTNLEYNYQNFVPKGKFLRKRANASINYEELYFPRLFSMASLDWGLVGTFRNFLTTGISGDINPFGYVDHFESRRFGIPLKFNPSFQLGGFYSSDYSRPFALDVRTSRRTFIGNGQSYNSLNISPRFQLSSNFFLVYSVNYEYFIKDFGYVAPKSGSEVTDILMGNRTREIVTNSIFGELVFTKRMGMNIRFRHYWQRVDYNYFSALQADGSQERVEYFPSNENGKSIHNTSFNAFTIDVNYKWVFYPGCEFLIFFKNNIFSSQNGIDQTYFNTFNTLFEQPQVNSISAKVLVFVDALYFRRKNKTPKQI
jgi:hypothetical protein